MNIQELLISRSKLLRELITESYDEEYSKKYDAFKLTDPQPISKASLTVLTDIPRRFGMCTIMSAYLCALLTDDFKLPAITVAGDLIIQDIPAFQTDKRIQTSENQDDIIIDDWQGHCWVEVGGLICDVSISRTADLAPDGSNLKAFVHSKFGKGRGLVAFPVENAYNEGMIYSPKEVLSDAVITAILNSYFSK